jgi:probable F420-dependent oxidoreductase
VVNPAGVALGYWQDRDPLEAIVTAALADELGYPELWIGEMATFDAFALATAVGFQTSTVTLTIGPLAPAVRDPAGLAMGVASVAALTGRPVQLAIGASSPVVVQAWHGRDPSGTAALLRRAAADLRALLDGSPPETGGYRLRLPPPRSPLTVAAFGPAAVRVAAESADRMVINLCTPAQAATLRAQLDDAAAAHGRDRVPLAAWIPAAVDPTDDAVDQLRRGLVPYLAAPGYGEMFAAAGFDALVAAARSGCHPRDLLARVPRELVEAVGLVGDADTCRATLAEHAAAGVDEVVLVPATAGDPGGRLTLTALVPA